MSTPGTMPHDESKDPSAEQLLRRTEALLHEQIPLTRAMQVRVVRFDDGELELAAPLTANHNHLGTAFGGSLAAVATLAGYALLWLLLEDPSCHVVIRRSTIQYRHPVRGDIHAVCRQPDAAAVAAFRTQFERTGKARITLPVTIAEEGRPCVEFEGEFVALR